MKRYAVCILVICYLVSIASFTHKAFAMPNISFEIDSRQPSGEKFKVKLMVYEDYTWCESDTGDIISKSSDGFWYYNIIENNQIIASKSKYKIDPRPHNAIAENELLKWREDQYVNSIKSIGLSKTSLSLHVGEMEQLTAMVNSDPKPFLDDSIIWSASNGNVTIKIIDAYGTVALIKAIAPGTVRIRATSKHVPKYYKECMVTVTEASDGSKIDSIFNKSIVIMAGKNKSYVNGNQYAIDSSNPSVTPIIKNNKIYIPLNFIAEKTGTISWDNKNLTAEVKNNKTTARVTLGSKKIQVNGKNQVLEAPVELINKIPYIAIGDVGILFGKKVIYNKEFITISDTFFTINADIINKTLALFNADTSTVSGLFPAPLGGKLGYIDNNGKIIIEPQFQDAMEFVDGLAPVAQNGKYGYINTSGEFAVKPIYDRVWKISDGMGSVLINKKIGYVDASGSLVIEPRYEFPFASVFSEGLACVRLNKDYGFIDKTGKVIIEPEFPLALGFSEGLSSVLDKTSNKWGYIDKSGEYAITPEFDFASSFNEGVAAVKKAGKFGYIDKTGNYVIEPEFVIAGSFSEGLAQVRNSSGKWGFIDKSGKLVIDYIYDSAEGFSEGLASVGLLDKGTNESKHGFINKNGERVIDFSYSYAESFKNGLAMVGIGGLYGYIDNKGKIIWEPSYISPFIN